MSFISSKTIPTCFIAAKLNFRREKSKEKPMKQTANEQIFMGIGIESGPVEVKQQMKMSIKYYLKKMIE